MSGEIVSKAVFKAKLGISDWVLAQLVNEYDLNIYESMKGKEYYDLEEGRGLLETYKTEVETEDKVAEEAEEFMQAKISKLLAETRRLEFRLDKDKEKVIPIEEIASIVAYQYQLVRARLLAIPNNVAPMLAGMVDATEIAKLIRKEVSEALDELSGGHYNT